MNYKQQGMFDPLPHLIFKVHVFETLCYSVFFFYYAAYALCVDEP